MRKTFLIAASAAAFVAAGAANAAITIYTDEASYLAAISDAGVDDYDDLAIALLGASINRTAGSHSYTASAANGLYGAGSGADHWLSTNTATDPLLFSNFSANVVGFGGYFFTSNIAGTYTPGGVTLTVEDAGQELAYSIPGSTTSSFVGFVSSTGIVNVTLASIPGDIVWPTANNLTLGAAASTPVVPEPATWAMMIGGFALAGAAMRGRVTRTAIA